MSITVVLQQMLMIFILIGIGIILFKKEMLSEVTSKQISGIIVNVTNPALLICSVFGDDYKMPWQELASPKMSLRELAMVFALFIIAYAILIAVSFLIPRILRVPNHHHYSYQMLTIFGNVGFIGIPLASAVLGTQSLIFVSIYNLIFNILIYTFGISLLQKAAARQSSSASGNRSGISDTNVTSLRWKKLINAGTISAAATIIFYLADFPVPVIVSSTLTYMGQSTTLLSMIVLGATVAQMALKDIFSHPKLYGFVLLRQILVPIGCVMLFRPFISNTLVLNTLALMLAVPAGNMPLMLSKQLHVEADTISQGIILTTLLSLVTIPIVCLLL